MRDPVQVRPEVVMIKIYVKDRYTQKLFQTSIAPKDFTAMFWSPPSIMEDRILCSTDEELEGYIDNINRGCLSDVPKELKANNFNPAKRIQANAPHAIEDSILGHYYESIKSNQRETPRKTGAAYPASKWCQKVDPQKWTLIEENETQLWEQCNGGNHKSLSAGNLQLSGLSPLLFKIPSCKTRPY